MSLISMFPQYSCINMKLKNYTEAFQAANVELECALRDYRDACVTAEQAANEALSNNEQNKKQIEGYINIARAHAKHLISASGASVFDSSKLARLAVQINNAARDDRFAAQLYTEASGQLIKVNQEASQLAKECERIKQTLAAKYETDKSNIESKISTIISENTEYLHSAEFADFLKLLKDDASIYNSSGDNSLSADRRPYVISAGVVQLQIPIPNVLKTKLVEVTNGLYSSSTGTIGIPVSIDISKGTVIISEYSNNNEQAMLSGIQNILLNIARYMRDDYGQIAFFDPIRFNNSSLGCLAALANGKKSFIDDVPATIDEIRKKLKGIISNINEEERQRANIAIIPKKRFFVFHNFPHAYDSTLVSQIRQLCVNASHYGITIVLTNSVSTKTTVSADVLDFLKTKSTNIVADINTFSICAERDSVRSPFVWYNAPQSLPKDVLHHVMSGRPIGDTSNVYENRVSIAQASNYRKGIRQITNIPFSIDSDGNLQTLDFENSNFATFICGAARSGKSTLLHTIITGIVKDNHPDDVEIWLIDFKMTEFSRYIDHLPPHVRYIILDESPELVYDIIDRLSEILMKRQNIFKGKWTKLGEVPPEKYMPAIFVIIDEFSVMSQIIADSLVAGKDNYSIKLQTLLAKGSALGLRFIFASQGFTSGTRGLNDFSKKQVQQRIAMKTEYAEIKATLDLMSASDDDKAMMEQLPVHHALLRVPIDERGNHLLYTEVLHISDYSVQEGFIDSICNSVMPAPKYDVANLPVYIDKKPMIIDGNNYFPFSAKRPEMEKHLREYYPVLTDKDEYKLFIGEPRRMLSLYPVEITNSFCENIMVVAPSSEKMATSSVVMSTIESLKMQGVDLEFWSTRKHPVYRQVVIESRTPALVISELQDVCKQIKAVKEAIQQKSEDNRFFILLGFESFIIDMSYQQADSTSQYAFKSSLETKVDLPQYEKRGENEPDIMTQLSALESGNELPFRVSNTVAAKATPNSVKERHNTTDDSNAAYDARNDLKFILTHGPKLGYHFIMVFNTAGEIAQSKIDMSLFRHKILFRIPKTDAMTLVGAAGSGVVAELEDRSFRYTDGLDGISFRPYLHRGLSWDGWQMSGDNAVNAVDEEEEYLL